jgi:hypothetical protein
MPSISPRRTLLALTLATLVGLPSLALAAPRVQAPESAREAHAGLFSHFWSFFQHLWGAEGVLIDPDGRAKAASAPQGPAHVSGDSGMSIDPLNRKPRSGPDPPAPLLGVTKSTSPETLFLEA